MAVYSSAAHSAMIIVRWSFPPLSSQPVEASRIRLAITVARGATEIPISTNYGNVELESDRERLNGLHNYIEIDDMNK